MRNLNIASEIAWPGQPLGHEITQSLHILNFFIWAGPKVIICVHMPRLSRYTGWSNTYIPETHMGKK